MDCFKCIQPARHRIRRAWKAFAAPESLISLPGVLSVILCILQPTHVRAQAIRIPNRRPTPQLFLFSTLTVTASPSNVNFALVSKGATTGPSSVTIVTAFSGGVGLLGTLTLYGYFASAAQALSGSVPVAYIPSSDIFGQVPTGTPTTFTAFTQTTPYSGASGLQLYTVGSVASGTGSRTDVLTLKIDLTATPQLPAATYTGVLMLEAQAF